MIDLEFLSLLPGRAGDSDNTNYYAQDFHVERILAKTLLPVIVDLNNSALKANTAEIEIGQLLTIVAPMKTLLDGAIHTVAAHQYWNHCAAFQLACRRHDASDNDVLIEVTHDQITMKIARMQSHENQDIIIRHI